MLHEPLEPAAERAVALERVGLERLHREQRDQPDQRADPQRHPLVVRRVQDVVEEAVFLVP